MLTVGFHLSGMVCPPQTAQNTLLKDGFRTSVVFDRQRITANNCTCDQSAWCQHIVALCLHRVNQVSRSVSYNWRLFPIQHQHGSNLGHLMRTLSGHFAICSVVSSSINRQRTLTMLCHRGILWFGTV